MAERSRGWRLPVLSLMLLLSLPRAGRAASLAEAVMAQLAAQPARATDFTEEKRLSSLAAPLVSHGRLSFVPPARLEKDTVAPRPERLVIDGDQLTIASDNQAPRTVALDEHPALRTLADTLRAVLAGDLTTLRRLYTIEEQGSPAAWRLLLVPNQPSLRRALARVTLDGVTDGRIRQIVIQQANGDEQRLILP